jgi:hypothetical protein
LAESFHTALKYVLEAFRVLQASMHPTKYDPEVIIVPTLSQENFASD